MNAEKSRRAIVRVARTEEPAKREEEEEVEAEEEEENENEERYRKSTARRAEYNIGTRAGRVRAPRAVAPGLSRLSRLRRFECVIVRRHRGEVGCSAENSLSVRPRRAEERPTSPRSSIRGILGIPRVVLALDIARVSRSSP